MKKVPVLLVCLLFLLAGCEQIRWVKIEEGQQKQKLSDEELKSIQEEAKEIVKDILEDTGIEETEEKETEAPAADRVDVDLGVGSAEIHGAINGVEKNFSAPYSDKDAIVFDIAKEWGMSVKNIRSLVYFNGKPYSIKAIQQAKAENAQELEKTIDEKEIQNIPIIEQYTSGIVRGIGCDLERGLLRLQLFNPYESNLPMYRNVLPKIKGALVVYLNSKIMELFCVDAIPPHQLIDCVKGNANFVNEKTSTVVSGDAQFELEDEVAISMPGNHEQFKFMCLPGAPAGDNSTESS